MPDPGEQRPHVAVVGGGIAGLAAARALVTSGARVTVLEGSPRLGGKLHTSEVGGLPVDEGAESFLWRAPGATELAGDVGLAGDLVHPAAVGAAVVSRGRLRRLPPRTMFGIPGDPRALAAANVLSLRGIARVAVEPWLPGGPPTADTTVGGYVRRRLGREVVDRLVDPLLGGVYAGRADALSLQATMPQLLPHLASHRSLLEAARAAVPEPSGQPVFATVRGGLGRLVEALQLAVEPAGAEILLGRPARELRRTASGWRVVHGSTRDAQTLDADGVVLALPAAPASRLLTDDVPAAATDLGQVDYASVALVTLVFPASAAGRHGPVSRLSGYLVPEVEGRPVKAVTFFTTKWPHLDTDAIVVRCSFGRYGDPAVLQRDDADLVVDARRELLDSAGISAPPVASRVSRWGGALPQYAVGHLDRVRRVRAAVAGAGGLAVCGAAYDGVGIPACIRSGQQAATEVLSGWTMTP
ncbi:MAG TPA: protoporphyrinogen oxidase [Mycobacteriales bacterium]|jgi:oxygen-dependent protoporphyrinogen oxidase|nr:protoporphyrinogen oxidase [Mycobacteriales bacterium]